MAETGRAQMTILIQYRDTDGKLRSFDLEADSIDAGESFARMLGYREVEGFELMEVIR